MYICKKQPHTERDIYIYIYLYIFIYIDIYILYLYIYRYILYDIRVSNVTYIYIIYLSIIPAEFSAPLQAMLRERGAARGAAAGPAPRGPRAWRDAQSFVARNCAAAMCHAKKKSKMAEIVEKLMNNLWKMDKHGGYTQEKWNLHGNTTNGET